MSFFLWQKLDTTWGKVSLFLFCFISFVLLDSFLRGTAVRQQPQLGHFSNKKLQRKFPPAITDPLHNTAEEGETLNCPTTASASSDSDGHHRQPSQKKLRKEENSSNGDHHHHHHTDNDDDEIMQQIYPQDEEYILKKNTDGEVSLSKKNKKDGSPRIAIVSLNSPGGHSYHRRSSTWMWPYAMSNRIDYIKKRGYALHVEGKEVIDHRTPPSWSKIKIIRKHLINYDYVFWVDMDVLFMNMEKKVEEFIAAHPDAHVLMAKDFNGINCGIMLWRKSDWSFAFLDKIWFFSGDRNNVWQEQYAMMQLLKQSGMDEQHYVFLPQNEINAYSYTAAHENAKWKEGNLLIHFANCDGRPHTCWEEFQHYWATSVETNGLVQLSEEELATQPANIHFW